MMKETKHAASGWRDAENEAEWEDFLAQNNHFQVNFTQSYKWGLSFQRLKRVVSWRLLFKAGRPVAGYIAVIARGKFYNFVSVVGGPAIDWHDPQLLAAFRDDIGSLGRQNACHFVTLCPHILDNIKLRQALAQAGFKKAPMGGSVEFAGVLDLSLSDEQLMANMSQSLRRKIRKTQKDDKIELRVSKDRRDAVLFAQLHRRHAETQNYVAYSEKRLICQFETYLEADQVLIYVATRGAEVLAMNMIFFYGCEASYLYGVSTPAGQGYSSAPLLHLAAIKEAKRRNLKFYNLWGITPLDQPRHRYFGVSQFKRGFGVIEHLYLPPQNLVLKSALYPFIWLMMTLRRRWRRL